MRCEFTVEGKADGPTNMFRDLNLLRTAGFQPGGSRFNGRAACRVYEWDGPWVSLGRFQSPERALYNPAATNWVTRPTGGKAVLHGHDITIAIAIPFAALHVETRNLKPIYRAIVQPIIEALRACGVPAALAESTTQRASTTGTPSADCFAFASPNDVVDGRTGRKVCGCALRLTETAALLQASVPFQEPLVDPGSIIRDAVLIQASWDASRFADALEAAFKRLNYAPVQSALTATSST